MKSVAFFNNKGGVGKTTLICNIGSCLALNHNKKVCVVDADPQCNATQYFFTELEIELLYSKKYTSNFTILNVIEPLSLGEGYNKKIEIKKSRGFSVDVLPGDPRLALTEDLLARDWSDAKSGEIRGIRTTLVFSELLNRLQHYDYVLFDVGPALGALNRSIMLSVDYFISPVSLDIFSLRAFENISEWINDWWRSWQQGLELVRNKALIPPLKFNKPAFVGYVTQSYLAKKDADGQKRAVQAYEDIRAQIDEVIDENSLAPQLGGKSYEIGTVPNLFSLVPMSQSNHVPIFRLTSTHGVVGAHFTKVKDAAKIFETVAVEFLSRIES